MFEKLSIPSLSLLNKFSYGVDDALKRLLFRGCILMIDEMYLEKPAQYRLGEYLGERKEEEENLDKEIVAFRVVGLKQAIPFVVQAIAKVTFNGKWLTKKFSDNIVNLIEVGLCVQVIVTNNHSANVNTFSALIKIIF